MCEALSSGDHVDICHKLSLKDINTPNKVHTINMLKYIKFPEGSPCINSSSNSMEFICKKLTKMYKQEIEDNISTYKFMSKFAGLFGYLFTICPRYFTNIKHWDEVFVIEAIINKVPDKQIYQGQFVNGTMLCGKSVVYN